jgi:hypothetical protein
MKNLYFFLIIFVLITYSCKDEDERINEDIKGVWKLESMQYEDSIGTVKIITDSEITITFTNDQPSISLDDSGFQIIGNDTVRFSYVIYHDCCNFRFEPSDMEKLPLAAIGRMMVYDFTKIDKKTVEFYTDIDFDYLNKQKLYKVSHLYSKISK